jgi:hypothetical protein
VNQSFLLVQLNVRKMEEGKNSDLQFGATEKSINVYKNACATGNVC